MRTVILENELLRVVVLVDKGSDIVEFRYKPLDLDFLYHAPGGIRNPNRGLPSSASNAPFLDYYSGGWNEILPNGGPHMNYKGADLGQHGEISLLPWDYAIVADSPQKAAVRLWVRPLRIPLFLEKTLSLEPGRAVLTIEERLVNEGGEPLDLMWGHHIAFGRPFLNNETIIDTSAQRLLVHDTMNGFEPRRFQPGAESEWPYIATPDGATANASIIPAYGTTQAQEMAYMTDFQAGWYAITNPTQQVGFGIHFDPELFRYTWYWQQLGNVAKGFPWWGRTHAVALEPWTSFPTNGLNEAVANGTALQLQPSEEIHTRLCAVAYAGMNRVTHIAPNGDVQGKESHDHD
ncbi:MAG: aldose 1-epimerase [Chloroflexi bacterium]|nr:MAG: aldose 1-epimerase [Chloroflexota bacterium]